MSANDREELERIGLRAAEIQRARAMRHASAAAWRRCGPWLIGVPVAAILLGATGIGPGGAVPTLAWSIALAFAIPLFAVAVVGQRMLSAPLAARAGLAVLDRELETAGRLVAAHEFASRGPRNSFECAAIADARSRFEAARRHPFVEPRSLRRDPRVHDVVLPVLSLLLAAIAALVAPHGQTALPGSRDRSVDARPTIVAAVREERESRSRERDAPTAANTETKARERAAGAKTAARDAKAHEETAPRESAGKSGEGVSTTPMQSSSASDSKGFDSAATPPNEAKSDARATAKKPAKPRTKAEPSEKKKLEASGATAGKGTGSGSSKNPGATDWQSKDQVTSDEEQPLDHDEEVDDETDESEARGGLQPSLRDRRPAVNRDLQIGFGNRPNPDANGRGGASEQKKSRGVASLVLGVPLPDHVKGHPNPGRTKITQERVEPRAEDAAPIVAAARVARNAPIGLLDRKDRVPGPWLDELVRDYFLALRKSPDSKTEQRP